MRLFEAEVEICAAIEEAWFCGKSCLLLIHGYNNGVAIKEFILNPGGLRKQMKRNFPEVPGLEITPKDRGATSIRISKNA